MVICCKECNNNKGSADYETFKARMEKNEMDNPSIHGNSNTREE